MATEVLVVAAGMVAEQAEMVAIEQLLLFSAFTCSDQGCLTFGISVLVFGSGLDSFILSGLSRAQFVNLP